MIRNHFIARKPGTDIAERVDLVLHKLGNPEPPLNLDAVRRLLGLELRFYPTDDKEFSLEAVSKIMVSTMRVYRRPGGHGRFPTRGSHRSGLAQFGHPAPRAMVSLRGRRCYARPLAGVGGSAWSDGRSVPSSAACATSGDSATCAIRGGLHGEIVPRRVRCR